MYAHIWGYIYIPYTQRHVYWKYPISVKLCFYMQISLTLLFFLNNKIVTVCKPSSSSSSSYWHYATQSSILSYNHTTHKIIWNMRVWCIDGWIDGWLVVLIYLLKDISLHRVIELQWCFSIIDWSTLKRLESIDWILSIGVRWKYKTATQMKEVIILPHVSIPWKWNFFRTFCFIGSKYFFIYKKSAGKNLVGFPDLHLLFIKFAITITQPELRPSFSLHSYWVCQFY